MKCKEKSNLSFYSFDYYSKCANSMKYILQENEKAGLFLVILHQKINPTEVD